MNFKDIALVKEDDVQLLQHLSQFDHHKTQDINFLPYEIEHLVKIYYADTFNAKIFKAIRYTKDHELKYRVPDLIQLFSKKRLQIVEVKTTSEKSIKNALEHGLNQIIEYHEVVKNSFNCSLTLVIAQVYSKNKTHSFSIDCNGAEVDVLVLRKLQIDALRCLYSNYSPI